MIKTTGEGKSAVATPDGKSRKKKKKKKIVLYGNESWMIRNREDELTALSYDAEEV